jgi:hypothetical protein
MIATAPKEQLPVSPSIQKYGSIVAEDGFTQLPRSVEDYLNSLDLCSTAILLIFILSSYRWTAEQEFFPSVKTLAKRCKVSTRRINQLTALLCELGLMVKTERFAGRSQLSNYYDIEPLFQRVAAWKSAEVAAVLAEEEVQADEPFQPANVLEEAAQIISEEFGEPDPRQIRYNAKRMGRRYDQNPTIEWTHFYDIIKKATKQTEERREEPTRTGREFTALIPYFFSALDWHISRVQSATVPAIPPKPQTTTQTPAHQGKGPQQTAKKSGILAERAAARKAAEAAGRAKVRAPQTLQIRIEAAALTFRDKQVKSSVQRAANLMADAHLDELTMCQLVADAREATSQASNVKARMPYFFSILEEKISVMLQ